MLAPRRCGSRDEEVESFAGALLFLNYNGIPIFQTLLEKQIGLLVNYRDVRKMGVKITVCQLVRGSKVWFELSEVSRNESVSVM